MNAFLKSRYEKPGECDTFLRSLAAQQNLLNCANSVNSIYKAYVSPTRLEQPT
jgi:hypothetical protein